jgi:hypothetical protein
MLLAHGGEKGLVKISKSTTEISISVSWLCSTFDDHSAVGMGHFTNATMANLTHPARPASDAQTFFRA